MKSQHSGFTLIELMIVVAIIAILAAIAIAQYQDYAIRAQVSEGASLADGVKSSIAEYYQNLGRFGTDNQSFGLATPVSISGRYVSQLDASNGIIDVTFGGTSHANIQGQHLIFSPIIHTGSIEWVCNRSNTLSEKYVPPICRH
ncbi:pilin [Noviluteimonas gilva]|uniref:Prepilin-type N-terminal cleavage/methylation domain-containing protein n=1 Tax=Noviluteimonas gilva TaxID=2682097 RepID=A0A7C9MLV3_9GAMM|nr:pilin [Lysobacter gilvus]MUV13827.1 prepilin-type N-terminal cleavage/methylation domain-containing protein [Lysobacter gilvus]